AASSACTPTTPGTWPAATTPSAAGSRSGSMGTEDERRPALAAVDCGTNSTRLLVSEGGDRTVERLMRITRLGQGVEATGALAPDDGPFLVVDIGGGSTEFVVGTSEPEGVLSVDMGCVRLTEKFLHRDPPAPEELSQIVSVARDHLEDVARELPASRDARRLVGLAGAVAAVPGLEQGPPQCERDRIRHLCLPRAPAEAVL